MQKLKKRWGITSNFQIFLIFVVFAINGSLAVTLANPLMDFLALQKYRSEIPLLYWFLRIILIFPIYQTTLIFVGACFGQFRFFWNIEKKILFRMGFGKIFKK